MAQLRSAMYATCLHCNAELGRNDVIEHFAVGRRLAFDAAKGRLWVICPACHRWNLTPLEERWEAIEECERSFRDTRLRTSTDNIGLARAANGLDLVRIGAPLRAEMAAWRYGSALQRRWREHWRVRLGENAPLVMTLTGVTTAFSIGIGSALVSIACSSVGMALSLASSRAATRDVRARVVLPDGQVTDMRALTRSGVSMRVETTSDGGWALRLRHRHESHLAVPADAERTLRSVLAYQNAGGGSDRTVATAVEHLVSSDDTSAFINRTARAAHRSGLVEIASYPAEVLLAFEMALHDESERRALDGELAALADEWELAEEVAKIADDMFLPDAVRARFDMLSARQRGDGT